MFLSFNFDDEDSSKCTTKTQKLNHFAT